MYSLKEKSIPIKGECSKMFLNNRVEWVDEWINLSTTYQKYIVQLECKKLSASCEEDKYAYIAKTIRN